MSSCLLLDLEIQLCNKAYTDLLVKRHKQLAWFRSSKLSWHPIRCLKSTLEQSKWRGTKNSRYKLIVSHLLTKRSKLVILIREGKNLMFFSLCKRIFECSCSKGRPHCIFRNSAIYVFHNMWHHILIKELGYYKLS